EARGKRQKRKDKSYESTPHVLRLTFRASRLPLQVEGDVGQDDALFEQQRCLEEQRVLVVQDALPPMSGKNLRDHDGHPGVRLLFQEFLDIVEEGTQDRAI